MSIQKSIPSKEFEIISTLEEICGAINRDLFSVGIGDDCAIRRPSHAEQLISTDISVENVHFSLSYMSLSEIGYRAMVSNISDIAAMGGTPDSVVLQIVFPKERACTEDLQELYRGIAKASQQWNISVIGGDLANGRDRSIGLTRMVSVNIRPLLRSGAQAGETVWVSGVPGMSTLGLEQLQKGGRAQDSVAIQAHVSPVAQIELGNLLADNPLVHSCIDISDGVAKESRTVCYASGVGMELSLPSSLENKLSLHAMEKLSPKDAFLFGGEDYELLFTADSDFVAPEECAKIGVVVDGDEVVFVSGGGHEIVGLGAWDHFE